jgi:hypothetical protein
MTVSPATSNTSARWDVRPKSPPSLAARDARLIRAAGVFGLGAAATYVATTAAGSFLDPTYSQIRQHVSDLTAIGAPTWAPLTPFYLAYNCASAALAAALYATSSRDRVWKTATALSALNTLAGVMMVTLFREEIGGTTSTSSGAGHIVFATVSSVSIVVASFAYGAAFRRSIVWRPLSRFSFGAGVAFAILGPLAAVATAQKSAVAGLAERGPIGVFVLWLAVVGAYSVVVERRTASLTKRPTE